jgi:hypothetical protein
MAKNYVAPIPARWAQPVIALLEDGDVEVIHWTLTAKQEFHHLGFATEAEAYDYCLTLLKTPGQIGECIVEMRTNDTEVLCETWAFLGPHPLGSDKPVYVKIGLHDDELELELFSLHIDRKGDLSKRIEAYLKKRS